MEECLHDEALYYYQFADAFGWLPNQVDEAPAMLIDRMLLIRAAHREVQAEQQRANRG